MFGSPAQGGYREIILCAVTQTAVFSVTLRRGARFCHGADVVLPRVKGPGTRPPPGDPPDPRTPRGERADASTAPREPGSDARPGR
ncbi:hypothetical protein GCM10010278_45990 [Streptomyces melanogenes]|nr:hypothetical protein GCM10010278_45990 [Streptomyces melanogenes]